MEAVKGFYRSARKAVFDVSEAHLKTEEATNDDAWGPHGTLTSKLAEMTHTYEDYAEIMSVLWSRMEERESKWRRCYKALLVLEFLIRNGSTRVIDESRRQISRLEALKDFHYIDQANKDVGVNIRHRAEKLVDLLNDREKILEQRSKAKESQMKYKGFDRNDMQRNSQSSFKSFEPKGPPRDQEDKFTSEPIKFANSDQENSIENLKKAYELESNARREKSKTDAPPEPSYEGFANFEEDSIREVPSGVEFESAKPSPLAGKKIAITFKSKNEAQSPGQTRQAAKLFAPPSSSNPVKAVPIGVQQPPPAVAKSSDTNVMTPSESTESFMETPAESTDKQDNDFFSDFAEAAPSAQEDSFSNWNAFVGTDQNHPQTQPSISAPAQQNGQDDWGDAFVTADTAPKAPTAALIVDDDLPVTHNQDSVSKLLMATSQSQMSRQPLGGGDLPSQSGFGAAPASNVSFGNDSFNFFEASMDNNMGPMSPQVPHGGYGGFAAGPQGYGSMGTGASMGFSASSDPLSKSHQSPTANSRLGSSKPSLSGRMYGAGPSNSNQDDVFASLGDLSLGFATKQKK